MRAYCAWLRGEFQFKSRSTLPFPAPETVRFDPDFSLLAKISFELPFPLLAAQIANTSDLIGRLEAITQLALNKDAPTVELLKKVLLTDAFYGARLEASKALRQIDTPESREALKSGLRQPDARVRSQVLNDFTRPYREESLGQALDTLGKEKNPDILATALRSLGAYSRPQTHELLLRQENKDLKRDLETLKKKVEALAPASSPDVSNAPAKLNSGPRTRPQRPAKG